MKTKLTWDETKRQSNLQKHGLDFVDAGVVLDSRYRMDVESDRGEEIRIQSFSYALGILAVLTVVHTPRGDVSRIISFRRANQTERHFYYDWLDNET